MVSATSGPRLTAVSSPTSNCRSRAAIFASFNALALDSVTPSRAAEAAEELARLERAFAALEDGEREMLQCFYVEGLAHAEIAAQRGTSEAYSRTLLSRALARLAKLGAR